MIEVLPDFLPRFLAGLAVNVQIALLALLTGLACGVPLAFMLDGGRWVAMPAAFLVGLLRAAPSFVVMFFLLNVVPGKYAASLGLFGDWSLTAVILSQAIYAAAYVADNGLVALRALRVRDTATAVLFLPTLARAFCVLLMASGVAAAVGTPEAIFITIREAERMPDLHDRVALFLLVMVFFALTMQMAFGGLNWLRFRLARALSARG